MGFLGRQGRFEVQDRQKGRPGVFRIRLFRESQLRVYEGGGRSIHVSGRNQPVFDQKPRAESHEKHRKEKHPPKLAHQHVFTGALERGS